MTTILRLHVEDYDDTELGAEVRATLAAGGVVVGTDVEVTRVAHRCDDHGPRANCVACGDEAIA